MDCISRLSKWFVVPQPNPKATIRLFCFPYAGGSAQIYMQWANYLNAETELVLIQPPGRGARILETAYSDMETLIKDLLDVFPRVINKPYILFGHSLGSRVAFELLNQLNQLGYGLPANFIASGSKGPYKSSISKQIISLSDDQLISELKKLNGTPDAILANKELLQFFMPIIRADLEIAYSYSFSGEAKFNCPLTVFGGDNDSVAPPSSLTNWQDFFDLPATIHVISGDHFFINSQREVVIDKLNLIIKKTLSDLKLNKISNLECNI
jgi:medium-chain acyl-[acyl-carrier-protein] hydrolase